jgi:hypothetical protein
MTPCVEDVQWCMITGREACLEIRESVTFFYLEDSISHHTKEIHINKAVRALAYWLQDKRIFVRIYADHHVL